ncbi:hypothetical protein C1646_670464 [Rhizophagus diaphanus]|nr:hypothetical protein C1646_670464 [Rhizophagus diaphanus] [Rhizophagus sp. MUCL 43196]
MENIARRAVLVGEHTTSVTRSIFKQQDQIVRDKYTRHLENTNVIYPHRRHTLILKIKHKLDESPYNFNCNLKLRLSTGKVVEDVLFELAKDLDYEQNEHSEITHYTNFLDRFFDDPDKNVVQWPNTALNESKTGKFEGRTKQPKK